MSFCLQILAQFWRHCRPPPALTCKSNWLLLLSPPVDQDQKGQNPSSTSSTIAVVWRDAWNSVVWGANRRYPDSCLRRSWRPGSAVRGTAKYTAVLVAESVVARQRTSLPTGSWCHTTLPQYASHLCTERAAKKCQNPSRTDQLPVLHLQ